MAKAKNSRGIYKRGKVWWITYSGPDGKQHFESTRTTVKTEAEYILTCRKKEVAEGNSPLAVSRKAKQTTFHELADRYEEFVRGQKAFITKRTIIAEMKKEFESLKLSALTLEKVEQWQARLSSVPRKNRKGGEEIRPPLAVASINRRLACLKHMLTKALDWELINRDTLDRLRRVKLPKEENRRQRYLTMEECNDLIDAAAPHLKPVLIFALNTGCRKGEILGLVWDRVDLKHGFIYLDKTKSGEPREIPINNTLREALQGIIRRIDSPFVFVNPETGGRYADLKRPFAAACRKAKIQDFRFHDLRHTFASQLVMAGVPLTTVSRLLGHASLTMTLRYSHLAPKHLQEAVDVLDRLQNRCPEVAPHSRRELKRTPLFHKEAQT